MMSSGNAEIGTSSRCQTALRHGPERFLLRKDAGHVPSLSGADLTRRDLGLAFAGLTSLKVAVLPGFGVDSVLRSANRAHRGASSPALGRIRAWLCGCACQQAPATAQVVGHGPEPDLRTGS